MSLLARKRLVDAYNKGYRIDKDGNAINPKGIKLKPRLAGHGYYAFGMRDKIGFYSISYHRLAAYQKFGDLLFEADCVRHLNGNCLDNSYDNIEIGTLSDNMMDIQKEVRVEKARIASPVKYKNVQEIRDYYSNCNSYKKTMNKFGIKDKSTLHYIIHKRIIWDMEAA